MVGPTTPKSSGPVSGCAAYACSPAEPNLRGQSLERGVMVTFVVDDSLDEPGERGIRVADERERVRVVGQRTVLCRDVLAHALRDRRRQEHLRTVERLLATPVANRLGEPLEVPHLLPGDPADRVGDGGVAKLRTVDDVLHDCGVLEREVLIE